MTKTAIKPTRVEDFAQWYQQVIQVAELADNAPVRGCMVIKPYGYAIWENIQKIFDARIKKLGVQNAYFPLLIPLEFLSKEAEHIEGFAKECAVITHSRLKKGPDGSLIPDGVLTEPYIIRPTSEAIIGNVISKWINTYRDLPMKLNQWCNVMRWEKRPRLFLRTSEFLWQEGHNVFATNIEAEQDAQLMLNKYHDLIEGDLALPAIKGEKTSEEKFPGAVNTYTIEIMTQDGKALQSATSHFLGQTFSKAFNIKFLAQDNQEHTAYTTSWGCSTRLIGGIIMAHADDDGLVLPPQIAPYQVVIIPIIHDVANLETINKYCQQITQQLEKDNLRVFTDNSEISAPNKIWKWIKKGAPIRIEVGIKEVSNEQITISRRDMGKEGKQTQNLAYLAQCSSLLNAITDNMRLKAYKQMDENTKQAQSLSEMDQLFTNDFKGFVIMDVNLTEDQEFANICQKHALSRRCMPINNPGKVIIAKSY